MGSELGYAQSQALSSHLLEYTSCKALYIGDQLYDLGRDLAVADKTNNSEVCFRMGKSIVEEVVRQRNNVNQEKKEDPFKMNI